MELASRVMSSSHSTGLEAPSIREHGPVQCPAARTI
jgi:hypothetical protein